MSTLVELIAKKRDGRAHDDAEIRRIVDAFVAGDLADYQMSAWLMAVFLRGMTDGETNALTDAMLKSGKVLDLKGVPGTKVDKHSTGGVGDKVSICLAPIVAACGVPVPMVSGRGLGHTGGTLDKLEAIPGFRVDLDVGAFVETVRTVGTSMIGQTAEIAPADKRIYALRDVTATVECIPLIVASILSKKLAEGIDALVLDVKVGRGAFMKDEPRARELAEALVRVGTKAGKKVVALLTDMSAPLGRTIGNALETREAIEVLHGKGPEDLVECTIALGVEMLLLGGKAKNAGDAEKQLRKAIDSGKARDVMKKLVAAQHGDPRYVDDPSLFAAAPIVVDVNADRAGWITGIDPLELGMAAVELGAGRTRADQKVEPDVGIEILSPRGTKVKKGVGLARIHAKTKAAVKTIETRVRTAFTIADANFPPPGLVLGRVEALHRHGSPMAQTTTTPEHVLVEDDRTGTTPKALRRAFLDHVQYSRGSTLSRALPNDEYVAWALVVRDRVVHRWMRTIDTYRERDVKRVYYLSAEFLLGRMMLNNLINLGLLDDVRRISKELGLDLDRLLEEEPDAGLGNGGLGRLAACFLDSLATLGIPAIGYGIRYEFGIFEQAIRNGYQVEKPDEWLKTSNPWEFSRPEAAVRVRFNGRVERFVDDEGRARVRWIDTNDVVGIPYDTPIVGHGRLNVHTLRLWSARASAEFDLEVFNSGDYERAVYDKTRSETISKVLYPNDSVQVGRELRLKQQYFFVACSIADIVRRHLARHADFDDFPQKAAIQLNDTHPSVAIPELMRILVDEHAIGWEKAWAITQATFAYTNHTLMSEALERWSVDLFERLLPRHLEIIYEINARFLRAVQIRFPNDEARLRRMSLIEEGASKNVRMANLAVVGSHSVNGVSELHTELLRTDVLADFGEMFPERFNNKTNGVTPRRWLLQCNPGLASLLDRTIGKGWPDDLDLVKNFASFADDAGVREEMRRVKHANKERLAHHLLHGGNGIVLDPNAVFDVQVKRIHEYKRQLLNVLSIVALYLRARRGGESPKVPVAFLFGGKAAPGYVNAKLIIRLIHGVAEVVNESSSDVPMTVHFLPNYRVSLAELIIPAADISEQISTAGTEASGTGNMKFALNGAVTLGTLDGANIEIRRQVGDDAFFLFGLTADQVRHAKAEGYRPADYARKNPELAEVLELVRGGFFSTEDRSLFRGFVDDLLAHDPYMVLADFEDYMKARLRALSAYEDRDGWTKLAIRNVAASGPFSSDRTIREYARDIWHTEPVDVTLPAYVSDDDGRAVS